MNPCERCGKPLAGPYTARRRFCNDACRIQNHKQDKRRARNVVLGVDSETVTDPDGRSRLVLVACSDGEHIAGERLGSSDAFEFLLSRHGQLWSFFVDYDVNFWLADLPQSALDRLRRTNWTRWQGYRVHHIPRRVFEVWHKRTKRYACVYDAFPYVQTSFVTWLRNWSLAPAPVVARIERMKTQRANFAGVNRARILRYTQDEVKYIAEGVTQLQERIVSAGLRPARWLGPGAVAARALRDHKTRDHFPRRTHPKAEQAYFGGRIETAAVGLVQGPLHYYDIASAYPAAAEFLPCFRHGKWSVANGSRLQMDGRSVALLDVEWKPRRGVRRPVWGPFPVRLASGVPLRYPTHGRGIYWSPEVVPWLKSDDYAVTVRRAWVWRQRCQHEPLAWVRELYQRRQTLKRAGDPAEYALKLVLNSIYGKFAQRVGQAPYRCVEYAGLITATTRGRLAPLLQLYGAGVLVVATDGIIMRDKLPADVLGNELGQWGDAGTFEWADIWQPGFYILADGSIRTRGFTRHDVDVEGLRREWRDKFMLGTAQVARRRVIGYRLATHQNRMGDFCKWLDETSTLYYWPMPRRLPVLDHAESNRRGIWYRTTAPGPARETQAELEQMKRDYDNERRNAAYADDGEPFGFDKG